ncbi:MAG: hypothetical protein FRX49_13583 [Trebouxia sp. A1-2]|nr:MAG: hypothetical protein FRX49_13583 [Trebouxia sp. A1-2]
MQVNSGSGVAAGMLRSCCKEKIQLHSLPTVRNIAKRPLMKAQLFEFFFATLRAPCGRESEMTHLQGPLLPDQVPSHPQGILVHSYDFRSSQDLLSFPAQGAQVCSNEQRGLEQSPKGKVRPLLIHSQSWVANLQVAAVKP